MVVWERGNGDQTHMWDYEVCTINYYPHASPTMD